MGGGGGEGPLFRKTKKREDGIGHPPQKKRSGHFRKGREGMPKSFLLVGGSDAHLFGQREGRSVVPFLSLFWSLCAQWDVGVASPSSQPPLP